MEIELSQLTAAGLPIQGHVRIAEEADGFGASAGAAFPEPLAVDGRVVRAGDLIVVSAHVTGAATLECGRCLTRVEHGLSLDFEARYATQGPASKARPPGSHAVHGTKSRESQGRGAAEGRTQFQDGGGEDDEHQLETDELDISFLPPGARVLVVDDVVREHVLLELPLKPLCREDCLGLCPRCGDDLNAGACACGGEQGARDLRFAALGDIKKKLEKN